MAELDDLFHIDQYVGPESLAELCLQTICENLDIISVKDRFGLRSLRKGLIFPSEICDKILEYVLRNDGINDHTTFTMFNDTTTTKLKRVKIVNSILTDWSITIVINHKLVDLELSDCPTLTKNCIELINANSENLRRLACNDTFIPEKLNVKYRARGYVFNAPNLQCLTLRYVLIPASQYKTLLAGLTQLRHLDLSYNYDIGNFEFYNLVPNLVSLTLYNVKISAHPKSFVENICQLKNLRHLDISSHKYAKFENPNKVLSDIVTGLPQLMSLDIGGTNLAGIQTKCTFDSKPDGANNEPCSIPGLASRMDRPLQFLGLYGSPDDPCRRHNIPAKMIAGDANEEQILVAARGCMDNKQELLKKVLNDLYHVIRYEKCHRIDQVLHIILEAMEKHPSRKYIQISGSATLFYIVRMKEKSELEVRLKKRIISTLLTGMRIHKNEETMIRNGCLTLCRFRIPQDVMSNYETLVEVLLHSTQHVEPEGLVQRIGIHLLNTLACQVEGKNKRLLGKLGCVKTMLELVKYRVNSGILDDVLEVAWSTMWNMTDETPINCQRFLDENGLSLFLTCIRQYQHKAELLRNMMGLLGNVAEVKYLRVHFMQEQFVTVFANLLRSATDEIEVSYNAAGILAHMASDGVESWTIEKPTRNEVLDSMVQAIQRWDISSERSINYRSFLPLLRLLDVYHTPQCQYWAVWALANLTEVYPNRYCALVVKEGGIEKLNAIISDPRPYKSIKKLAQFVTKNCSHYNNNFVDVNVLHSALDVEYSLDD